MTARKFYVRFLRCHLVGVSVLACAYLGGARGQGPAKPDFLPQPRRFADDTCPKFSTPEFERLLSELKAEREGLDADGKTLAKRLASDKAPNERDGVLLEKKLQEVLQRLKTVRPKPARVPMPELPRPSKGDDPPAPRAEKKAGTLGVVFVADSEPPTAAPIDPLHLAQALLRAEQYAEALAAFRKVDLKGKKADARAPIQYLMAICLYQVGKSDEAITLLREVANSRGDLQAAQCAQWQVEMLRWQRDVRDRLQDVRQRRLALEKRP